MDRNVGSLDRSARIAVGAVLVAVGALALVAVVPAGSVPGAIALVAGVVALSTGALRSCPVYRLLGVDSCGRR